MRDLTVPQQLGIEGENEITVDQLQRVMPKGIKTKVTPELVKTINDVMTDTQLRESYRDNLLSYTSVMADGKFKIGDYVNAVRYVSHKLLGATNIDAYAMTFPNRFQRLTNEGADPKTISSYSTAYNKTQLVQKIFAQTLVPMHVLNADLYQKALNHSAYLMLHAKSEKVQSDSANNLMNQLKAPEVTKLELDLNVKEDKSIQELKQATVLLAAQQRDIIRAGGMSVQEVAHSDLVIEGSTEDNE